MAHVSTFFTRKDLYDILNPGRKFHRLSHIYEFYMLTMILLSIIPLLFLKYYSIFKIFDIVSVIAFIIDYVARWSCADIELKKSKWKSFLIYPFTPMAIIDLLSILPGLNVLEPSFKLLRLTRIFRIFRVIRAIRYSKNLMMFMNILRKQKDTLLSVLALAIAYVLITAIIMFNVEPPINPTTGNPTFKSFFDALYWATITLTSVGYGDIVPVTTAGRIVSMLSAVFGVAIIALPSGVITGAYLNELNLRKEKHRNDTCKTDKEPEKDTGSSQTAE